MHTNRFLSAFFVLDSFINLIPGILLLFRPDFMFWETTVLNTELEWLVRVRLKSIFWDHPISMFLWTFTQWRWLWTEYLCLFFLGRFHYDRRFKVNTLTAIPREKVPSITFIFINYYLEGVTSHRSNDPKVRRIIMSGFVMAGVVHSSATLYRALLDQWKYTNPVSVFVHFLSCFRENRNVTSLFLVYFWNFYRAKIDWYRHYSRLVLTFWYVFRTFISWSFQKREKSRRNDYFHELKS